MNWKFWKHKEHDDNPERLFRIIKTASDEYCVQYKWDNGWDYWRGYFDDIESAEIEKR